MMLVSERISSLRKQDLLKRTHLMLLFSREAGANVGLNFGVVNLPFLLLKVTRVLRLSYSTVLLSSACLCFLGLNHSIVNLD